MAIASCRGPPPLPPGKRLLQRAGIGRSTKTGVSGAPSYRSFRDPSLEAWIPPSQRLPTPGQHDDDGEDVVDDVDGFDLAGIKLIDEADARYLRGEDLVGLLFSSFFLRAPWNFTTHCMLNTQSIERSLKKEGKSSRNILKKKPCVISLAPPQKSARAADRATARACTFRRARPRVRVERALDAPRW